MEVAHQVRVILLDIEGTTTPISFVSDVLFPYAARNLDRFIRQHLQDPEVHSHVVELNENRIADLEANLMPPAWRDGSEEARINSLVAYGHWLMDRDSKRSALKWLQGKIWEKGYSDGELAGQVYGDVPQAFQRWRERGKRIYIYSSGSVLAQKLLFQTTQYGDLTNQLDGYFDTRTGPKKNPASYQAIVSEILCEPRQVLFISDTPEELTAARSLGVQVALSVRAGNRAADSTEFPVVHSFDEIVPA